MDKRTLLTLWGILFIVCAALGFIPGSAADVQPAVQGILTALSVVFFLPPAALIWQAHRSGDRGILALVRNLAALSLGLTLMLLVGSMATALAPEAVGNFLHILLILVATPMVCSGYWVLSLFLWACLLAGSVKCLRAAGNVPQK